jgi:hypothetical protein
MILSGTGRWRREAVTEGGFHTRRAAWKTPSTSLRLVPLPVPGRIYG